jgi:hypothetical protein
MARILLEELGQGSSAEAFLFRTAAQPFLALWED